MSTPYPFDDPFSLLRPFRAPFFAQNTRQRAGVFPAVNIYDDGESFLVRAEMPGVDKDSLDISCKGEQLVIRGERRYEKVDEAANFHRRERESGQFRRAVTLPEPIDGKKVSAEYKNGILEIYAPRAEEARPRQIRIKG